MSRFFAFCPYIAHIPFITKHFIHTTETLWTHLLLCFSFSFSSRIKNRCNSLTKNKRKKFLPCFGNFAVVPSCFPPDHKTLPPFTFFCKRCLFLMLFCKTVCKNDVFLLLFHRFFKNPFLQYVYQKTTKNSIFERHSSALFRAFRWLFCSHNSLCIFQKTIPIKTKSFIQYQNRLCAKKCRL